MNMQTTDIFHVRAVRKDADVAGLLTVLGTLFHRPEAADEAARRGWCGSCWKAPEIAAAIGPLGFILKGREMGVVLPSA